MAANKKIKKIGLALAGAGLIYLVVGVLYYRWALNYQPPCSQPCRDLGEERISINYRNIGPVTLFRPRCNPVRLELEVFKPETRTGRRYTLWYRVRMKNVSCFNLNILRAHFFIGSKGVSPRYYSDHGFRFKILDPKGRDVEDINSGGPGKVKQSEYGNVIPYDSDHEAHERMKTALKLSSDWYFSLDPGQEIATNPFSLAPYYLELGARQNQNGPPGFSQSGPGMVRVKAVLPNAPVPPPGFRVLENFVFDDPGKYRIQVVMDAGENRLTAIYPYERWPPLIIRGVMSLLGIARGNDFSPVYRDSKSCWFGAQSNWVEFRVTP